MNYRKKCLNKYSKKCHICSSDDNVEVHHINGKRWDNSIENLIPVCKECHGNIHSNNNTLNKWTSLLNSKNCFNDIENDTPTDDMIRITISLDSDTLKYIDEKSDGNRSKCVRKIINKGVKSMSGSETKETVSGNLPVVKNKKKESHCENKIHTSQEKYYVSIFTRIKWWLFGRKL